MLSFLQVLPFPHVLLLSLQNMRKVVVMKSGSVKKFQNPFTDLEAALIPPTLNEHRVSPAGLLQMFQNEIDFCLKSFATFSNGGKKNNSQCKLISNQFIHLFKKFDGHLDEMILLKKYVETGEKLLEINGFHQMAKERCFLVAKARMEGNGEEGGGEASINSLSAKAAEPTSSPSNDNDGYIARKHRLRRTFGTQLSDYFNIKHRVLFGEWIAKVLEIIEFDFGLKSTNARVKIVNILQMMQSTAKFAAMMDPEAHWVVFHAAYHSIQIVKFVTEQTNSFEVSYLFNLSVDAS
jgi:hypothetical protein